MKQLQQARYWRPFAGNNPTYNVQLIMYFPTESWTFWPHHTADTKLWTADTKSSIEGSHW